MRFGGSSSLRGVAAFFLGSLTRSPARLAWSMFISGLHAGIRLVVRSARFLFILLLVALPLPVANLFIAILRGTRRDNLPAQVLKKE
jgi:hypothetical protein